MSGEHGELPEQLAMEHLVAVRDDLLRIVPAVRAALNRNEAHEALVSRLERLESERNSLPLWKIAADIHKLLARMRKTRMPEALLDSIETEILDLLSAQGFEEFGSPDDPFDERRHQLLETPRSGEGHHLVLAEVHARGLRWMNRVVVKAQATAHYTDGDRS